MTEQDLLTDSIETIRGWSLRTRGSADATVINLDFIFGTGAAVISPGIQGALQVGFRCRIIGVYLLEFDEFTNVGSVLLDIRKASMPFGAIGRQPNGTLTMAPAIVTRPTWTSIVASRPPTISTNWHYEDETLTGWATNLQKGDWLRIHVTTVSTFQRLGLSLRLRRKEP